MVSPQPGAFTLRGTMFLQNSPRHQHVLNHRGVARRLTSLSNALNVVLRKFPARRASLAQKCHAFSCQHDPDCAHAGFLGESSRHFALHGRHSASYQHGDIMKFVK